MASLLRDLKSSNWIEMCAALQCASRTVNAETVHSVFQTVKGLVTHQHFQVRRHAINCLHAFHSRLGEHCGAAPDPRVYAGALCDKEPSVMTAAVNVLHDVVRDVLKREDSQAGVAYFQELVPTLLQVLQQIVDHKLNEQYNYHSMPAPWTQIKILKLAVMLCRGNPTLAVTVAPVLRGVLARAETDCTIGHAITYECIRVVTLLRLEALYKNAASAAANFLGHESPNNKYLGLVALSWLIGIDLQYAQPHQQEVVRCLEAEDDSIKAQTIDLLFSMANSANVEAVVDHLLRYAHTTIDTSTREHVARQITQLVQRFAPTKTWYVETINDVIELGVEKLEDAVLQQTLRLVAEGQQPSDEDFRARCVELYRAKLCGPGPLQPAMCKLVAWVLGEYTFLCEVPSSDLIDRLLDQLELFLGRDDEVCVWLLTAILKLVAGCEEDLEEFLTEHLNEVLSRCSMARCTNMQEVARWGIKLSDDRALMAQVLPLDGCCADLDVDPKLPFVETMVQEALAKGAGVYKSAEQRSAEEAERARSEEERRQREDLEKQMNLEFASWSNLRQNAKETERREQVVAETNARREKVAQALFASARAQDREGQAKSKSKRQTRSSKNANGVDGTQSQFASSNDHTATHATASVTAPPGNGAAAMQASPPVQTEAVEPPTPNAAQNEAQNARKADLEFIDSVFNTCGGIDDTSEFAAQLCGLECTPRVLVAQTERLRVESQKAFADDVLILVLSITPVSGELSTLSVSVAWPSNTSVQLVPYPNDHPVRTQSVQFNPIVAPNTAYVMCRMRVKDTTAPFGRRLQAQVTCSTRMDPTIVTPIAVSIEGRDMLRGRMLPLENFQTFWSGGLLGQILILSFPSPTVTGVARLISTALGLASVAGDDTVALLAAAWVSQSQQQPQQQQEPQNEEENPTPSPAHTPTPLHALPLVLCRCECMEGSEEQGQGQGVVFSNRPYRVGVKTCSKGLLDVLVQALEGLSATMCGGRQLQQRTEA